MHNQVLVIYPKDVDLKDIMYWYQEVDKTQKDKINDERCQFFLTIPEDDIPSLLTDIKEYLESNLSKYYEILEYRSCHSLEETKKEYNMNHLKYAFDLYKDYYDDLKEYEKIKDLPYDDPSQIRFILDNGYMPTDKLIEFYIKGKGSVIMYINTVNKLKIDIALEMCKHIIDFLILSVYLVSVHIRNIGLIRLYVFKQTVICFKTRIGDCGSGHEGIAEAGTDIHKRRTDTDAQDISYYLHPYLIKCSATRDEDLINRNIVILHKPELLVDRESHSFQSTALDMCSSMAQSQTKQDAFGLRVIDRSPFACPVRQRYQAITSGIYFGNAFHHLLIGINTFFLFFIQGIRKDRIPVPLGQGSGSIGSG